MEKEKLLTLAFEDNPQRKLALHLNLSYNWIIDDFIPVEDELAIFVKFPLFDVGPVS